MATNPMLMGGSQTILIVDDEFGARSALRALLERQHSIRLFSCGSDAIEFVRGNQDQAHAAFVDFTMPGMNGAMVCRALSSLDPTLSLIGITGSVKADFQVPVFAIIEKRGAAVARVRETAAQAIAATLECRRLRDEVRRPP